MHVNSLGGGFWDPLLITKSNNDFNVYDCVNFCMNNPIQNALSFQSHGMQWAY